MKIRLLVTVFILALACQADAKSYREMFGEDPPANQDGEVLKNVDFQQGTIKLPAASVTLNISDQFYYLSPEDTRKVVTDLWGNPKGTAEGALGMLFPANHSPVDDDSWGSVIEYNSSGYVSDADAATTNFDEVLQQIKDAIAANNPEREKAGYPALTLAGWAAPPYYDKTTHAMHWARDLIFGKAPNVRHSLNYSVRVLGREGVLELNFVAGLTQLAEINAVIPSVITTVQFDPKKRYSDYVDGDKMAAYGLAGMIAAGAGVKIAAKLGLLALGLGLLKNFGLAILAFKKGLVVLVVPIMALWRRIISFFTRKKDSEV